MPRPRAPSATSTTGSPACLQPAIPATSPIISAQRIRIMRQRAFPETARYATGWCSRGGAAFDHNSQTHFALTGKHAAVRWCRCHAGQPLAGTPAQCSGCHQIDFQKTTSPNHVAAAFAINCGSYHATTAWKPASYDHNQTRFPLTGRHTTVDCASCHTSGEFSGISLQCSGCHLAAFQRAANPNHVGSGFPTTCETCHTTTAWRPESSTTTGLGSR